MSCELLHLVLPNSIVRQSTDGLIIDTKINEYMLNSYWRKHKRGVSIYVISCRRQKDSLHTLMSRNRSPAFVSVAESREDP